MGIYNNKITEYVYLPLWRCKLCNLEMKCVGKGKASTVMTAPSARRRFTKKHEREKPNCPGSYTYVPGVKKPR